MDFFKLFQLLRKYKQVMREYSTVDGNFIVAAAADTAGDALISNCLIRVVNSEWPFETYNHLYISESRTSIHNKVSQNFLLL